MSGAPNDHGGGSSDGRFRRQRSDSLHLVQAVHAPRALIWRACAEPAGLVGWQADAASGELRRGGSVTLSWPSLGASVLLDVSEVDAPRRVVFRNGDSKVEMLIADDRVELTHSGLGPSDDQDALEASWRVALALLAHYCERHPEQPRSVHWLVGRTRCSAEAAHAFFTDAGALASWLTRRGSISATESSFALELASGAALSGKVLANVPGHDVAISWTEEGESALVLRTLPAAEPRERIVALAWSRWTTSPPPAERLEELEAAHARLLRALDRRLWM